MGTLIKDVSLNWLFPVLIRHRYPRFHGETGHWINKWINEHNINNYINKYKSEKFSETEAGQESCFYKAIDH